MTKNEAYRRCCDCQDLVAGGWCKGFRRVTTALDAKGVEPNAKVYRGKIAFESVNICPRGKEAR